MAGCIYRRRREHPQTHLKDFQGILQADASAGYAPLHESGKIKVMSRTL
jgi:hypothetical protein